MTTTSTDRGLFPKVRPAKDATAEDEHRMGLATLPIPLRWAVIGVAIVIAFHGSLRSIVQGTYNGDPLAYLLLLPLWALILGWGTQLRRKDELFIHDRQTDWIAASLVFALLAIIVGLLAPRLGEIAGLVRIDVLAILIFTLGSCVLLFGTRATGRYYAPWAFVFASWPLPYIFVGSKLGGTSADFAVVNVLISAGTVWIAIGGQLRLRVPAVLLSVFAGVIVAYGLRHVTPIVLELVPAVLAPLLALTAVWRARHRTHHEREHLRTAVARPIGGALAVLMSAVVVSVVVQVVPPGINAGAIERTLPAWQPAPIRLSGEWATASKPAPWTSRYFGATSTLGRYTYRSTSPRNRTIAPFTLDVLTDGSTGPLSVYPAISCYQLVTPYLQDPKLISLGHHVRATLLFANSYAASSPIQSEWVMLTWLARFHSVKGWRYQRFDLFTLSGQPQKLGIPPLAPPFGDASVRGTFTAILRGSSKFGSSPDPKTLDRIRQFASRIVRAQSSVNR